MKVYYLFQAFWFICLSGEFNWETRSWCKVQLHCRRVIQAYQIGGDNGWGKLLRNQGRPVGGKILLNRWCPVYQQWPGLRDLSGWSRDLGCLRSTQLWIEENAESGDMKLRDADSKFLNYRNRDTDHGMGERNLCWRHGERWCCGCVRRVGGQST